MWGVAPHLTEIHNTMQVILSGQIFDCPNEIRYMDKLRYESIRESEYHNWRVQYPALAAQLDAESKQEYEIEYQAKKKALTDIADGLELKLKDVASGTPEYDAAEKLAREAAGALQDHGDSHIENPSSLALWINSYGRAAFYWAICSAILTPQILTKLSLRDAVNAATKEELDVPVNFFLENAYTKK